MLLTKARYLESVTSLTSKTFQATYRKFTTRRVKPLHVYSVDSTTFIGVNLEFK